MKERFIYLYVLPLLISDIMKTTKVVLDVTGGLRIYISRDIESKLKWKHMEEVVLFVDKGKLIIFPSSKLDPVLEMEAVQ